jgi:hypothetical protein
MENQTTAPETQSLGSRIMNVFASPGEAFDGISAVESKTSLWLLPMLTAMAVGILIVFVYSTNATIKAQIVDIQTKQMQKMVDQGKMTQAQADQAVQGMESMGMLFVVFGAIGAMIVIAAFYFVGSALFWLAGKFILKSPLGYSNYLALYGTAGWIGVFGAIVTVMMAVGLGSMYATPSAALAVYTNYDIANSTHRLLSRLEIFSIWQSVVVGIGLAKLTGKSIGAGIGISLGLLLLVDILIFVAGR